MQTMLSRRLARRYRRVWKNWDLYLLLIPVIVYFIVFYYAPMYGVQIAFRKYSAAKGISGSKWVGMANFVRFFESYYSWRLISNTVLLSLYDLALGFPIPILLALMMNEVGPRYRKFAQTVTYIPHFLSVVVLISMLNSFLQPGNGIVNQVRQGFGLQDIYFMGEESWFRTIYVVSGVWQNMGWASIIYVSALAGIDTALYEAAQVDGASRFKMLWHITLPGIAPTIIIMLILNAGRIMNIGFEKVLLMQNDLNITTADVISTYVYRSGLINAEFSFSSAIGLFNSVINCLLLLIVNGAAKVMGETSLW